MIDAFVEHHKLPRSMHRQIRSYFDYRHSSTTYAHEMDNALVDDLSPQLRMNVRLFLYADIVAKVRHCVLSHVSFACKDRYLQSTNKV